MQNGACSPVQWPQSLHSENRGKKGLAWGLEGASEPPAGTISAI